MFIDIKTIFTKEEIKRAKALYRKSQKEGFGFAKRCREEIVQPVMARIDAALGQENDPMYMAYVLEYEMMANRRAA